MIINLLSSFVRETKLEIFTNCDLFKVVGQVLRALSYAKNDQNFWLLKASDYFNTWPSCFRECYNIKKYTNLMFEIRVIYTNRSEIIYNKYFNFQYNLLYTLILFILLICYYS